MVICGIYAVIKLRQVPTRSFSRFSMSQPSTKQNYNHFISFIVIYSIYII